MRDVLKRDKIKQRTMAAQLGISGSTLSPILSGKYPHTMDRHVQRLRDWCVERDRELWGKVNAQAKSMRMDDIALCAALGVDQRHLEAWKEFRMPLDQRVAIDKALALWLNKFTLPKRYL